MLLEKKITLDFCDTDLVAEPNDIDIWEHEGNIYFTLESAIRESEKQGLRLPSKKDWEDALSEFDGDYDKLREYLGLKFAGNRNSSRGSFYGQDYGSYYWASSPYGVHAYYAYFNSGGGNIANNIYRSDGFSARCLKN